MADTGFRALASALISSVFLVSLIACQRNDQPRATQAAPPPVDVAVKTVSPRAVPVNIDAVGSRPGAVGARGGHRTRLQLDYTSVRAPITGVTGRAEKSEGSLVAAVHRQRSIFSAGQVPATLGPAHAVARAGGGVTFVII